MKSSPATSRPARDDLDLTDADFKQCQELLEGIRKLIMSRQPMPTHLVVLIALIEAIGHIIKDAPHPELLRHLVLDWAKDKQQIH